MGYLHFDNSLVQNLGQSLLLEDLATSRTGAYRCSTICGCNTRKYHGELIVPTDLEGKSNLILVSSIDETLVECGMEYKLGIHEYGGGNCAPQGQNHIKEVRFDKGSAVVLRAGGVVLEKTKLMASESEQMIVRYRVLDAYSDVEIKINPFLAFRDGSELCVENDVANSEAKKINGGFSVCLYKNFPTLYVQTNTKSKFCQDIRWIKGVHYFNESDRGYHDREDLLSVGYVDVTLKKGTDVYLSLSTSQQDQKDIAKVFEAEYEKIAECKDYLSTLKNSARKHIVSIKKETVLKSEFPWNNQIDARDMLISLPGATLYADNSNEFENILKSVVVAIENLITKKKFKTAIEGIDNPDVVLWLIWAIQKYAEEKGNKKVWAKYGDLVKNIIHFVSANRHPNIEYTESSLLYIHAWDKTQTWMKAKSATGMPITPRSGFVVEINALWYNALMFAMEAMKECDDNVDLDEIETLTDRVKEAFTHTFWNGTYLYDFVDGDHYERSVRPNMLFAVSLKYSPLEYSQKKAVVDMATKELLTPKGLRSLSPNSNNFHRRCEGGELSRGYAAYQGSVHPWLMGTYVEAYLRTYKKSGLTFVERCLHSLESEVFSGTLGTFGELYDATSPYREREGMSSIKNIAEILRANEIVAKYKA